MGKLSILADLMTNKYYNALYSYATFLTDETLAKDILQEVFISVSKKVDSLNLNDNMLSYLKQAVFYEAISYHRKINRRQTESFGDKKELLLIPSDDNFEKDLINKDRIREISQHLTLIQRRILKHVLKGKTNKQVGKSLNLNEDTVKKERSKLKRKLRLLSSKGQLEE